MTQMLHNWLQADYGRVVSIPKDFRIGFPSKFGWFIRRGVGQQRPVTVHGLDGLWVPMAGGPLPVEVLVRVEQAEDGRWLLTGLVIGLNSHREITWETLRSIRPATLLSYLFSGFDPRSPLRALRRSDVAPAATMAGGDFDLEEWRRDDEDLPAFNVGSEEWRAYTRAQAAFRFWSESRTHGVASPVEPITKARASVAINLNDFAEVYLRQLASSPGKATLATAEELHVSRATVIRRLAECRELGLIPPTARANS